jgi:hypothetical protein
MAELKTKATGVSVDDFLRKTTSGKKLEDSYKLIEMMRKITKEEPKMWGPSIIGFGQYHYKYASGHEGDMPATAFSPRKPALTLYVIAGFSKKDELLKKLGKYKISKACLYIKSLDDVDLKVLKELIAESYKYIINKKWP